MNRSVRRPLLYRLSLGYCYTQGYLLCTFNQGMKRIENLTVHSMADGALKVNGVYYICLPRHPKKGTLET
ncbi:MAG: hypothetical protein UW24_C0011G0013 [Parcubacteria group bacterium GW2011_GWA2_44_12]|nr:MAG: hypothetical protein UW24_C0011G0013 [Parcubacteria group bacterium GW2011_GWA2_44_12]